MSSRPPSVRNNSYLVRVYLVAKILALNVFRLLAHFWSGRCLLVCWAIGVTRGHGNFGDLITPELVRRYNLVPIWVPARFATVLGAGSLLQKVPASSKAVVIGSGTICPIDRAFPHARFVSVRGELTRKCLSIDPTTPLGDPGALADMFIGWPLPKKEYDLAIIPHYTHRHLPLIKVWECKGAHIINVLAPPSQVIEQIAKCRRVASSSLHGLIVADALGVPNVWITMSNPIKGDRFKFDDYYSSLGVMRERHALEEFATVMALSAAAVGPAPNQASLRAAVKATHDATLGKMEVRPFRFAKPPQEIEWLSPTTSIDASS